MDLEEMKHQWSELNTRMEKIESNLNNQNFDKMKTAQQQLISQYRKFVGFALVFTCLSCTIFSRFLDNVWLELGIVVYFAVCAVMNYTLQRKVGEIDLGTMSVAEVAERATACRRLHHIFQIILIPSAIVLLALLAYTMSDNEYFIYGMCGGAVVGLALGLIAYFKFMDNYKSLIKK